MEGSMICSLCLWLFEAEDQLATPMDSQRVIPISSYRDDMS